MKTSDIEDRERLLKLEELILELQELSDSGAIIVVEGLKDIGSLRLLGINGEIRLASQQPLLEFTDLLSKSKKEIILLTDWDNKGGLMAVSYTHLRAHETRHDLVCRLLLEKKKHA